MEEDIIIMIATSLFSVIITAFVVGVVMIMRDPSLVDLKDDKHNDDYGDSISDDTLKDELYRAAGKSYQLNLMRSESLRQMQEVADEYSAEYTLLPENSYTEE